MAVNFIRISDLEIRNGDDQSAGVVANHAGTNEAIYEQEESTVNSFPGIVGRSAALQDVPQGCASSHDPRKAIHGAFFLLVDRFIRAGMVRDNTSGLVISVADFKIRNTNKIHGHPSETRANLCLRA